MQKISLIKYNSTIVIDCVTISLMQLLHHSNVHVIVIGWLLVKQTRCWLD